MGDSFSKRRSCVDATHPPHSTAEESFLRRVNRVVEICPLAKNPLPLMKAKEDTMPDGVRMIGANKQAYMYAGVSPLRRSGTTEYIKMRVVGEDRMALKDGPDYGTSSEGVNGQGSAALLSDPPISNCSRALGGGAWRRAAHAEVPSAKQDLVNKPIKKTKTPPRLDNSEKVRSGGAGEKVPEKQIFERSEPEKNSPRHGLPRLGLPGKPGRPDMGSPDLGLNFGPKNGAPATGLPRGTPALPRGGPSPGLPRRTLTTKKSKEPLRLSAPVFVPATKDALLLKNMQEEENKVGEIAGWKYKLVERSGVLLKELLTKSNP